MRAVRHISLLFLLLLLGLSAVAQMRTPPPASIYSIGGSTLGGPPASIYSLPSQPIGRTCCGINIRTGGGGRHRPGHRPGGGVVGYPVYYPVYSYPYGIAVEPPSESLPGAGTFDRPQPQIEASEPAAPTVFERRPTREPARTEEDSRYGEHYLDSRERSAPSPELAPAPAPEPEPSEPTVLIFRNGERAEVRNYAIMGSTVYVLSPERRKIQLAELDLPATVRENDERGLDFRVPAAAAE